MPPIRAVLGGFGSAQWVAQDFPEYAKIGHAVKDILGKNILQFGFIMAELIKNCLGTEDISEVCPNRSVVIDSSVECTIVWLYNRNAVKGIFNLGLMIPDELKRKISVKNLFQGALL